MWCKYILARHVTLSKVDCAPRAILSRSCGAFFHVCTSIRMSCTCACVNVCVVVTSLLLLVVHVVQIYISTACDSVKGGLHSSSYFESFKWCNFSILCLHVLNCVCYVKFRQESAGSSSYFESFMWCIWSLKRTSLFPREDRVSSHVRKLPQRRRCCLSRIVGLVQWP
jgi:hypothetical protein